MGEKRPAPYYIGAKQVQAYPCNYQERDGYTVLYPQPDGTQYESWSPKDVFESAYLMQGNDPTRVTQRIVDDFIVKTETTRMGNHTVVMATLRNGFTVVAEAACVDPANYNEQIGRDIALKKIQAQVWNHLGFLLASAKNGNQ
ncbi:Gp49 family protein [Chrysiogenes arsenatis]|uniref:Gp49 family protein n=1 Tax=Chrysiogenes arsenatis TaxID=309797 RepID=UPI00041E6FCF|nr:Gp49 family protein [Chrysiogenes arsenatis]